MKKSKANSIYTKPEMNTGVLDIEGLLCASVVVDVYVDDEIVEEEIDFEL